MSAPLEKVREHGHVLTPGRYVGAADVEDDGVPFAEKFAGLREKLEGQLTDSNHLNLTIRKLLAGVGLDG